MAEKGKAAQKVNKAPTAPTPSASSSRRVESQTTKHVKDRATTRPKNNKANSTISTFSADDGDIALKSLKDATTLDMTSLENQMAYGKFLRAMLQECLIDEKIEREETQMDVQMALLADRFQKTIDQLDRTSQRLKDISFGVERQRLINLKNNDCSQYYKMMEDPKAAELLTDLNATEKESLNNLTTHNIDFGYNKESGHQQLMDAMTEAIEGLDSIKKNSHIDTSMFEEFEKAEQHLDDLEKDHQDIENLKAKFEKKFPEHSEKLVKLASEKIARMLDEDEI